MEVRFIRRPVYFWKRNSSTYWVRGFVGTRTGLDFVGKITLAFSGNQDLIPWFFSYCTSHYTDWVIRAPVYYSSQFQLSGEKRGWVHRMLFRGESELGHLKSCCYMTKFRVSFAALPGLRNSRSITNTLQILSDSPLKINKALSLFSTNYWSYAVEKKLIKLRIW